MTEYCPYVPQLNETQYNAMREQHLKRIRLWKRGDSDLLMSAKCGCKVEEIARWREDHKLEENQSWKQVKVEKWECVGYDLHQA